MTITDKKKRGEWAELRFMAKASEHGFNLTKPWGDSLPYDLAIDLDGRLIRVQVKSTLYRRRRLGYKYVCLLRRHIFRSTRPYLQSEFDFLAIYLIPRDIWYIIPSKVAVQRTAILLCPDNERNRYHRYREAWHLLREPDATPTKKSRGFTIHAMQAAIENHPPL